MIQQTTTDHDTKLEYFNQMQKEIIEALRFLKSEPVSTTFSYTTDSEELCTYLDTILGPHSTASKNTLTLSDERELPELLENLEDAHEVATEQGNQIKETDTFEIENPAELTLFEQTIIIAETSYIRETNTEEYLVLDLTNTKIDPFDSIPLFYKFTPMILNNQQVALCNSDKFLEAVEDKPIPGISEKLSVDVTSVKDLPFETETCEECNVEYVFSNTHQTYCHENSQSLSKIQRNIVKGLVVSGKGEFICTDDGWCLEVTDIPLEFAEWVQDILSDIHRSKIIVEDDTVRLLTYPSNTFTELVEWQNGQRKLTHSSTKELISILFAIKGTVDKREVFFDIDEDPDKCAEMFEIFESFRVQNGKCVVSLSELEVFIGDIIPGFESKWKSNMTKFQEIEMF